jgi:redox-sensing transcriptional repressor
MPRGKQPNSSRSIWSPPLTVRRLSIYLRYLEELANQGQQTVSSRQLGQALGLTDAQVRKDLAWFGHMGRPGVGYRVAAMVEQLRAIFGTDKVSSVAVIGVGSLGRALLRYKGFLSKGFRLSAAFDVSPHRIGRSLGECVVQPLDELEKVVAEQGIRIVILAVPAAVAQEMADRLVRAGIVGILNFAPVTLTVPEGIAVIPVDMAVQLEQLAYMINAPRPGVSGRPRRRQGLA